MRPRISTQALIVTLFFVYLIGIFWIIVLKFGIQAYYIGIMQSFNWIPYPKLFGFEGQGDGNEILLNIFIFVPFGLYTEMLWSAWPWFKKIVIFTSTSLLFEICQYLLRVGTFDSTDISNNSIGGMLGIFLFLLLQKLTNCPQKAKKITLIPCLIGTISVSILLIFLKLNHLWIFRMELIDH